MAHGYFKIEGKPILCMAHGTVGLQHASMALYNAYADRVPVYLVLGNEQEIAFRRSDVEWTHAVQDAASMVRDYTAGRLAVSLGHFAGRQSASQGDDDAAAARRHLRQRRAQEEPMRKRIGGRCGFSSSSRRRPR
jgi:hypothetical protein